MNTQSEALRLADALDPGKAVLAIDIVYAAAELRRLHAQEQLGKQIWREDQQRISELHALNQELLEACQTLVTLPGTENWIETLRLAVDQARAAIAKAGEQK